MRLSRLLAILVIGVLALAYGATLLFTNFRPLGTFARLESSVAGIGERAKATLGTANAPQVIETSLATITMTTNKLPRGIKGWGGALVQFDDQVVVIDAAGEILRWGSSNVASLGVRVPMELEAFNSAIGETTTDSWDVRTHFRVLDSLARKRSDGYELIVSHNVWHNEARAKSVRVSMLKFDTLANIAQAKWRTLLECKPLIPEAPHPSPFSTNQSGGRIDAYDERRVLIVFGDLLYGTSSFPIGPLASEGNCFGRAYLVDTETGETKEFAKGLRNAQGLLVDSRGRVWETEHGPRGGDELNLLEEGADYGWPHATYGTAYRTRAEFLPSTLQGDHTGYRRPIFAWVPSVGISNLIEVKGAPEPWDGDLLVGSLRSTSLYRVRLVENRAVVVEAIPIGVRVRDISQHSDGRFLIWTDGGEIVELAIRPNRLMEPRTGESAPPSEAGDSIAACIHCHSVLPNDNSGGPTLHGVVGRAIASTDYGAYSAALKAKGGTWSDENLRTFLKQPSAFVPGTTMPDMPMSEATIEEIVKHLQNMHP